MTGRSPSLCRLVRHQLPLRHSTVHLRSSVAALRRNANLLHGRPIPLHSSSQMVRPSSHLGHLRYWSHCRTSHPSSSVIRANESELVYSRCFFHWRKSWIGVPLHRLLLRIHLLLGHLHSRNAKPRSMDETRSWIARRRSRRRSRLPRSSFLSLSLSTY